MTDIVNTPIVTGTADSEELEGVASSELFHADGGDDSVFGAGGDDTLIGGLGSDLLVGGSGSDVYYGGLGDDFLQWESVNSEEGDLDRLFGGDGSDSLVLSFRLQDFTQDVAQELLAYQQLLAAGIDPGDGAEYAFSTFALRAAGFESVLISVDGVELAPGELPSGFAFDDQFTTADNQALSGDVTLNDNFDPQTQEVRLVASPGGIFNLNRDGTFTFDPNDGFLDLSVGETTSVSFQYLITENQVGITFATATITIEGANEDPTANDFARTTDEDTNISLTAAEILTAANANDIDRLDTLSITAINGVALTGAPFTLTLASGARLDVGADGALTYRVAGFLDGLNAQEQAFDTVAYTISDDQGGSVTRVLELTVDGINDAPLPAPDTAATDQNTAIQIDLGLNDFDFEDATLTYTIPESAGVFGFVDAVIDFNGAGDPTRALGAGDGVFVSIPTGVSITLAFLDEIITDGVGDDLFIQEILNGGERADVEVSSDGVNFTFIGQANAASLTSFDLADINFTGELRFVRLTGLDNGGSSPGFDLDFVQAIGTQVEGIRGDVTDLGGGVISYDPGGDFDFLAVGETATETFSYVVTDSGGLSATTEVTVTVTGENDAPEAADFSLATDEDTNLAVSAADILLQSDASDPDDGASLSIFAIDGDEVDGTTFSFSKASGASVTVGPDGGFTYEVAGNFDDLPEGVPAFDSLTFTLTDGEGGFVTRTINLQINGVNDAPEVEPLFFDVFQDDGAATVIDPLESVFDIDSIDLTADNFVQTAGRDVFANLEIGAYRIEGPEFGQGTRIGVPAAVGDINGDGLQDFAIISEATGGASFPGRARIIYGGATTLSDADAADSFGVDGVIDLGAFGASSGFELVTGSPGGPAIIGQLGDVNGDGIDDLFVSAVNAGDGDGEVYVVFGAAGGLSGTLLTDDLDGSNGFRIGGYDAVGDVNGVNLGLLLPRQNTGDVTGDGVNDILFGVQGADVDGQLVNAGQVYLVSGADLAAAGAATGFIDVDDVIANNGYRLDGDFTLAGITGGHVGEGLSVGDLDGDGINDILAGAPRDGGVINQLDTGAAYVVFGGQTNLENVDGRDGVDDNALDVNQLNGVGGYQLLAGKIADQAGIAVSVIGDVNGDGISDLLVGAREPTLTGEAGGVHLVFGGRANFEAFDANDGVVDGIINLENTAQGFGYRLEGVTPGELTGTWVVDAGDFDGDGVGDFMIGNNGSANFGMPLVEGRSWLVSGGNLELLDVANGGADDNVLRLADLDGVTGFTIVEEQPDSQFGLRSDAADIDGDGTIDLLISANTFDRANLIDQSGDFIDVGASYVFRGGSTAFAQLDALDGAQDGRIAADTVGALIDFSNGAQGAFDFDGLDVTFDPSSFVDLGVGDSEDIVFEYEVSDGIDTVVNTLTITVNGANDAPVGGDAFVSTDEDTALSANLIDAAGIVDPDANDTLSITAVNGVAPVGGSATVNFDTGAIATVFADGRIEFDPLGFYDELFTSQTATEALAFTVSDGNGGVIDRTATIEITGVNDAPVGRNGAFTTDEDSILAGDLSFIDGEFVFDPENNFFQLAGINDQFFFGFSPQTGGGQITSITNVTGISVVDQNAPLVVELASGAIVSAKRFGEFEYDPNGAFEGLSEGESATDSFTFHWQDEAGARSTYTATFQIDGVNDAAQFGGTATTSVSLVSVTADGLASGDFPSTVPQISVDGATVAFTSNATNLVTPDANGSVGDIFLADIDAGTLEQVNLIDGTNDQSAAANTFIGAVDGPAQGRYVVFHSRADDLNGNDANGRIDVYLRDLDTGATELISANIRGVAGNGDSLNGSISADGRYIAFQSTATDLIANDVNGTTANVFLHDRLVGETIQISNPDGTNSFSAFNPRISEDGSTVVFSTFGSLVAEDTNGANDIYAYDVPTGAITLVSKSTAGVVGDGGSQDVSVSANGRYVFFSSAATNLVDNDTNGVNDGFVHDRVTGVTERVTVSSSGVEADARIEFGVNFGQISADGRFVAFTSRATNLVDGEVEAGPGDNDVFLHDRLTGETIRVTTTPDGGEAGGFMPSISGDGARVAFATFDDPAAFDPLGVDGFEDVYVADIAINGGAFETDDGAVTVDLLAGFFDPEGGDLDIANVVITTDGGRTVDFTFDGEAGTLRFDATQFNDNATGAYELLSVAYDVISPEGLITPSLSGVSILRSDLPISAANDAFTTDEDSVLTGTVAANDTPIIGGAFTLIAGPAFGDLVLNSDGTFTYDPTADLNFLTEGESQTVSFTYQLDFEGLSDQGVAVIDVSGVNDAGGAASNAVSIVDLVTINLAGDNGGNNQSLRPHLTGDGTELVFDSIASNIFGDANARNNVYVADLENGNALDPVNVRFADGNLSVTNGATSGEISEDGRYVVFHSRSSDLVDLPDNNITDVYLRDTLLGTTELISVGVGGVRSNGDSIDAVISANGRYIAYQSAATNLTAQDANGAVPDIFLHDRATGETTIISQPEGVNVAGLSRFASISDDGSVIVFQTENALDTDNDNNNARDQYAYNIASGDIHAVSVSSAGAFGNGPAGLFNAAGVETDRASISDNGRYVAFTSSASNLVAGDTNGTEDVFVRDLLTGETELISKGVGGVSGDFRSFGAEISGDGRFVVYRSVATNLDPATPDTNGIEDIYLYDRVTGQTSRVSITPDLAGQPGGVEPTISDDGSVIAFASSTPTAFYDPIVATTNINNIYVASVDRTGFSIAEEQTQAVNLAQDYLDPEGETVFQIQNLTITSDNPDRGAINFTPDLDANNNPLSTGTLDTGQFADLGANEHEILTVTYELFDGNQTVPVTTAIVINGENDAPIGADASFTINGGATFSGTFVATDKDFSDVLTAEVISSAIPGTLTINGPGAILEQTGGTFPREFSFDFDADPGATGQVAVDVEVTDSAGESDILTLTFDINAAPAFAGFDGFLHADTDVLFTFDAGALFTDPEGQDLTFNIRRDGGLALPNELTFDAATGVISGTPLGTGLLDIFRLEVTATDTFGASTTVTNWLTITDSINEGTAGDDILNDTTVPDFNFGNITGLENLAIGGLGNDSINAGEDADIYLYRRGDGFDFLVDNDTGDDDIVLMQDINPEDVTFRRAGTNEFDLIVELTGTEYQFTDGFYWVAALPNNTSGNLDRIHFDDGTVLSLAEIRARVVSDEAATAGNVTRGTLSNDTLQGQTDGAVLIGNGGNDTYLFNPGDGFIAVDNITGGSSTSNAINFGFNLFDPVTGDIVPQLHRVFETNNDDLILDFGNGDILTVHLALEDVARISSWNFTDTSVTTAFFRDAILQQEGTAGNDIIIGFDGTELRDTLIGGPGDDYLDGFDGIDTYIYNAGDGNDTIGDTGDTANLIVNGFDLVLDGNGGVDGTSEVTFERRRSDGNGDTRPDDDLLISFDNGTDQGSILLYDILDINVAGVFRDLEFNGPGGQVIYNIADIRAQIISQAGTAGDDVILGFDNVADTLQGRGGDDFLNGRDGTDTYIYNAGDGIDTILDSGGADEDLLQVNGFDLVFDANGLVDATSEVDFSRLPGSFDLKIALDNGTDTGEIIVKDFYAFQNTRVIENLEFTGDNGTTTIRFSDIYFDTLQRQVTAGDDIVIGPTGSNFAETYFGGTGDDIVDLGGGDDIYNFNAGDQRLRIVEGNTQGFDTLNINDYTFAELEFDMMPYFALDNNAIADLRIRPIAPVDPEDEIILVEGYFDSTTISIDRIVDSTGATMTRAEAVQRAIDEALADGDPYIYGTGQTDVFSETIGADVFIRGRGGNDTYSFAAGDGYDTYREDGAGGSDTVNLVGFNSTDVGSTITLIQNNYRPDDIWFDFGNGDRLFLANTEQFETIRFTGDGVSFSRTQFNTLVANNAVVVTDISDDDGDNFTIFTSTAADERFLGASNGVNPATGNVENDQAFFTIGQIGHDIIQQGVGQTDVTINLGASGQISFERGQLGNGSDIIINVFNAGATSRSQMETIRVVDFDKITGAVVENLTLITDAGTTTMTADEIGQAIVDSMSTAGDDSVIGFDGGADGNSPPIGRGNETIIGGAGDDYIRGGGGVSDATGGSQEDVYRFTIGAGGQGGDGRDTLQDAGAGDMDRVEFISAVGDSAAFVNADIYFAPDDRRDVIIDFGFDEVRVVDLARNVDSARIDAFVFDAGGTFELTLTDLQLLEFAVADQTSSGDDTIFGTDLNDTLNGGAGDDYLQGFVGDDTYIYTVGAGGVGGGRDIIDDASAGNNDVVRIISGGTTNGIGSGEFGNVSLRRDAVENETLVLDFGADELRLRDFLDLSNSTDYTVIFDAGGGNELSFTREALIQQLIAQAGTDGDDEIVATRLADTINGGLGDDTIIGDANSPDVFEFAPNEGDDVLFHPGNLADNATIRIFANFADVDLRKVGDPRASLDLESLLLTFNAGGSVEVVDAFARTTTSGEIANWVFDDVTFTLEEIHALTMQREIDRGVNQLLGDNFDDIDRDIDTDGDGVADVSVGAIRGTARDEFMSGGAGADTYIYTVGAGGYDTILDGNNAFGVTDRLIIEGARSDQVIFKRGVGLNQELDLILRFENADGQIHIINTFRLLASDRIEQWVFRGVDEATGSPTEETFTLFEIMQRTYQDQVTPGDDIVFGSANGDDDFLPNVGTDPASAGGNDSFSGLTGDDTYIFIDVAGVTQRMIIEDNGNSGENDALDVQGYDAADVTVRRVPATVNDLLFEFNGSDDQIIVLNSAVATASTDTLETFTFNGVTFTRAEVIAAADGTGALPGAAPGAPLIGGPMAEPEPPVAPEEDPPAETETTTETESTPAEDPTIFGDDTANLIETGAEADVIRALGGADTVRAAGGDDDVWGGDGADILGGGAGADTLRGEAGADRMNGGGGADLLAGGGDADTILGGFGADTLRGNGGADLLRGGAQGDTLLGGGGDDTLRGEGGADRLDGWRGNDVLAGGGGGDTLIGGAGADRLAGGAGTDRLVGGGQNDRLLGGGGDDALFGGGGADILVGGAGNDRLTGGLGADRFVFNGDFGRDVVLDYQDGFDRFDFRPNGRIDGFDDLTIIDRDGFALIRDGFGNVIRVNGVDGDDLTAADFLF